MSRYENDNNDNNRYENDQNDNNRYENDHNDNDHYYVAPPAAPPVAVVTQTPVYYDDRYENDQNDNDHYYATAPAAPPVSVATQTQINNNDDYDGQAFRLYMAALDRTPDPVGLASWTSVLRSGADIDDVSREFVTSAEFQSRYGALNDSEFVTQLYQNVLNRAPDASGQSNWMAHLNAGESREHVLTGFSESTENRLQAAALVNGVDYQSWVG